MKSFFHSFFCFLSLSFVHSFFAFFRLFNCILSILPSLHPSSHLSILLLFCYFPSFPFVPSGILMKLFLSFLSFSFVLLPFHPSHLCLLLPCSFLPPLDRSYPFCLSCLTSCFFLMCFPSSPNSILPSFLLPKYFCFFLLFPLFSILLSLYHMTSFFHPWILSIMFSSFLASCPSNTPHILSYISFSFRSLFLPSGSFFILTSSIFIWHQVVLSWFSPIPLSFFLFASPFFFLVSYNYSCQLSFFFFLLTLHSKSLGLVRSLYCF